MGCHASRRRRPPARGSSNAEADLAAHVGGRGVAHQRVGAFARLRLVFQHASAPPRLARLHRGAGGLVDAREHACSSLSLPADPCGASRSGEARRLVGAAGFEPATPCSQSRCATRLRYAPATWSKSTGSPAWLPRRPAALQADAAALALSAKWAAAILPAALPPAPIDAMPVKGLSMNREPQRGPPLPAPSRLPAVAALRGRPGGHRRADRRVTLCGRATRSATRRPQPRRRPG